MSIQVNKIVEKSKENNSNSDYNEEEEIEENDNIAYNKKVNYKISSKNKISNSNLRGSNLKNPRLSCQPNVSFMKRHDSNYTIRQTKTRKKTTAEYCNRNNNLLSYLALSGNTKMFQNEENKYNYFYKDNKKNNGLNNSDKKNSHNQNYIKINSKLNIYQREKKNIERKNNYIKKKKELQNKEINEKLKGPTINKISQEIMDNKSEYIPIQYRAAQLHRRHLSEYMLNENKKKLKKIEEEKKEYEIVKYYRNKNKKTFNENDWNKFIKSQEYWIKEKQYKAKAAELLRNNYEYNFNYVPKIDKNSKLMIKDRKEKKSYINDIHIRLYNDFNDLQERKKLNICNSMPSFKPILNKSFNKNKFNNKKKIIKNDSTFYKKLDLLIKNKLNNSKKIISHNPTKYTSRSYKNNSGFKTTKTNFIFNINKSKNKKSRYDENYYDEPIFISHNNENINKTQNLSTKSRLNNKNNKNRKKQKNNIGNNIKNFVNNKNNINKNNFVFNRNNNSLFYSKTKK